MFSPRRSLPALAVAAFASAALFAGCSGDSQPEYCDRVDELRSSVTALTDISIDADTITNVESDLQTVETNAQAVVDAAREDFPEETDSLETAVNNASDSAQELPSSPSAAEVAALAIEVAAVGSAASDLYDATNSACE
jgi:Asp-tRNA(Asn)/Glu-tRNA(Gln) amidotransferase C subunit